MNLAAGEAVGVRDVKHIAEPMLRGRGVQQGNAAGAFVDPSPQAVPYVDPGAGGRGRLLLMDQKLFHKVVFEVLRGSSQKRKIVRLG